MSSISESRALELARVAPRWTAAHTRAQLLRVFPDRRRTDSTNFDPSAAWALGPRLPAQLQQTWDLGMRLNFVKFALNGGCGMVPKPARLLQPPPAVAVSPPTNLQQM